MRYVPANRWPLALIGYTLAGAVPAAVEPALRNLLANQQIHPGAATAILVNLVIPLFFVATAVIYPRASFAVGGVALAFIGFAVTRLVQLNPLFWHWNLGMFLSRLNPFVTVSTIVSGAIAMATCFATNPLRRVGVPPPPNACHNCGYDLGANILQCPECGEVRIKEL
ncbi:MAG: hypothetical protein JNK16_15010 [Phycisphaerales bacterium]|nr:hypothetical protein [Phycisphaerales bacterium]